jgi:PEP-CTERM motif-containing protein
MRGFKVLAVLAMVALAFTPLVAEATSYSSSVLLVTNGSFSGAGFSGTFDSFFFRLNQTSTTLNGVTISSPGTIIQTTAGSSLDQPVVCQGGICGTYVNNVFFPTKDVNAANGSYAYADTHELVTTISAGNGTWGSATQSQLTGAGTGSAQTGTDNTLQWNFTSGGGLVTFSGLLSNNFELFLDTNGNLAHGTGTFTVEVRTQTDQLVATLFDLSTFAAACSSGTRVLAGDSHPCDDLLNQAISGGVVLAPGAYSLLIHFGTSTDVLQRAVPEPVSMSLFGLGLVGVAFFARRRRA